MSMLKVLNGNEIIEAWGFSCRGASHQKNNTVCEDANAVINGTYHGKPWVLGVSADGLGGKDYYLSQYGSQYAVNLLPYFTKFFCSKIRKCFRKSNTITLEDIQDILEKFSIRWTKEITSNFKTNGQKQSLKQEEISVMYATTLLFALYYENTWLFAQLGDGDIYYYNKSLMSKPVCIFPIEIKTGATDALGINNGEKWKCKSFPSHSGDMITICSDGFSDSFEFPGDDSDMVKDLYEQIQKYGNDVIFPQISPLLDKISTQGSQDDVTMVSLSIKMV